METTPTNPYLGLHEDSFLRLPPALIPRARDLGYSPSEILCILFILTKSKMKDTSLKLTREEVETYTRVSRKTVANFFYNMEDLEFIVKESKGHYNISGLVLHLSRKTKE